MVNLTIDGQKVSVPQGTTIMQAAATVGIEIPRLCYLKGINEISACKVCVVEIQGQNRVVTACTTPVQEGLVVYTNSPKARSIRRTNVELILSQHDCMCATCVRSGNCSLQTLANDLGIYDIPYERDVVDTPWNQEFPLIRDSKNASNACAASRFVTRCKAAYLGCAEYRCPYYRRRCRQCFH